MSQDVVVLGAGVSGLTCGILLLQKQFQVTLLASQFPPFTTSNVAAAVWYPFKASPREKMLHWSKRSFQKFETLTTEPASGISWIDFTELHMHSIPEPWWSSAVLQMRCLGAEEIPPPYQVGFMARVPVAETPLYLPYLLDQFQKLGGKLQSCATPLNSLEELNHPLLVNCTGLGARDLCQDFDVFPIRGQVVRTSNPGIRHGFSDDEGPLAITYIIPRSNDCILGGTAEENQWGLDISEKISQQILAKSQQLEPRLKDVQVLETKVGLRPGRTTVRLERERISPTCQVIHNYGHGGSGFTLSWGCAEEVVQLVEEALYDSPL